MKKLSFILSFVFVAAIFFTSCDETEVEKVEQSIIPEKFTVDIPSSLSSSTTVKSAQSDTIKGEDLYEYMRSFIHIGEEAAGVVEEIISTIRTYHLSTEISFSYQSEEDGRTKNVIITANQEFEGTTYDWQMIISDADSEENEDGGVGVQIFWNTGTVEGIAIVKPYNLNRNSEVLFVDAMFRIDYSEAGEEGYDQEMTVYISGLTLPEGQPLAMETMKMTVRKKDNIVEVYGNSNHPNANVVFGGNTGVNWAFVAAGTDDTDLGVAEVGLPPSNLNSSSRKQILEDYALKNVLEKVIQFTFPNIPDWLLTGLLKNAEAPAYFSEKGFVAAGDAPNDDYVNLNLAIEQLVPYNPFEISNLTIEFKASATAK